MTSKKLEIALFNIYDVIVFEDENGITQDCVCSIYKDEVDEMEFDVVECNGHCIDFYGNDNYEVWEKDRKNISYYATNKRIIHLYTLKNDNRFYEIYPTSDYESTDNFNSSEALECLDKMRYVAGLDIDRLCKKEFDTIKQALTTNNYYKNAFELINEKRVDINLLHWAYPSCEAYNIAIKQQKDTWVRKELSPEEFEFLGRLAGAK